MHLSQKKGIKKIKKKEEKALQLEETYYKEMK